MVAIIQKITIRPYVLPTQRISHYWSIIKCHMCGIFLKTKGIC